jgi:hypothetical protein
LSAGEEWEPLSGFFTDPQGRVRPIEGKKKKGGAWGFLVTGAAVAALAVGGAGGAGDGALNTLQKTQLKARASQAKEPARKGRADEAWGRMRLKSLKKKIEHDVPCLVNSTDQVRRVFVRTPCRSLHRALFLVGDEDGNLIVVSVAWVRMTSQTAMRRLKDVEDEPGTGDITPIAGPALGLAGITFTAHHYRSRAAGTLLVVAETEPAGGSPPTELLDAVADVAGELPPP